MTEKLEEGCSSEDSQTWNHGVHDVGPGSVSIKNHTVAVHPH